MPDNIMENGCKHHVYMRSMCLDHFNTKRRGKSNKNIKKTLLRILPRFSHCDVINEAKDQLSDLMTPHIRFYTQ